jgi:hypothetical protein
MLIEHLAADGDHFFGSYGPGHESDVEISIVSGFVAIAAQNENWKRGQAAGQFGYESRPSDSGQVEADNHKAQIFNELRLFHKDECFSRIGSALDAGKTALQNRPAQISLQGIVIHQ